MVDVIGVVAGATDHRVHAAAADEHVVADAAVEQVVARAAAEDVVAAQPAQVVGDRVAGQRVVEPVTGAVDKPGSGEHEVLEVAAERVTDLGNHGVDLRGQDTRFNGLVAAVVDVIGVVAGTAAHDIDARAPVEHVVAGAAVEGVVAAQAVEGVRARSAGQGVVEFVARAVGGRAGQGQVFDKAAQGVTDAALDGVHAAGIETADIRGGFKNLVAGVIHQIGVVAAAAEERVVTCAAIEQIIARVADEGVVAAQAAEGVRAGIAGQGVVEFVARAVDSAAAGQG